MPILKPQLTALTYAVVAAVIDGEAKTAAEVSAAIDCTKTIRTLKCTLRRLVDAGILDREYAAEERVCFYRINETGKQAFRETLDYYVFLAQKGPQQRQESGHREQPRLPTDQEEKRIVETATDPFRSMYLTMRILDALPGEVIRLKVEDVDLAAGIVLIGNRRVLLDVAGRRLLAGVIGERQAGALFPGKNGGSRGKSYMTNRFQQLRNQLNLGRNVMLCGVTNGKCSRRSRTQNGNFTLTPCVGADAGRELSRVPFPTGNFSIGRDDRKR